MKTAGLVLITVFFAGIFTPVFADKVYLKSGKIIECEIKRYMTDQIGVQEGKKFYYISNKFIEKVEETEEQKKDTDVNWGVITVTVVFSLLGFILGVWGRNI